MQIPQNWTFRSAELATNFGQHVREQLPWYDLATSIVIHIARHYIPHDGMVYDIGASTGNIGSAISEILKLRSAKFVAIDSSHEMKAHYSGPSELTIADAITYPYELFDFAVCFLVLTFIPPAKRDHLIATLRSRINPGGALVVFDKCEPTHGYVSTVMLRLTIAGKVATGVDAQQIIEKELSLAGVQRPLNPSELGNAQEIFRFGDFAGWIIEP